MCEATVSADAEACCSTLLEVQPMSALLEQPRVEAGLFVIGVHEHSLLLCNGLLQLVVTYKGCRKQQRQSR
jgi:hypothetical protein